ncbi:hypothetical protein [Borrelia persica]|uniref:hypothetical protein n=1 Tax=Borrelia persica TaxID=44448 RepID=UPI0004649B4A|nr:hypothetical protein [Borrelia persica]
MIKLEGLSVTRRYNIKNNGKDGKFIIKDTDDKKAEFDVSKGIASSALSRTFSTLIIAVGIFW